MPPEPPLAPRALLRWALVSEIIRAVAPTRVLEVGCGLGAVGARLAREYSYVGIEPDDAGFATAERVITPLGGTVVHGTHRAAPHPGSYDVVCAFEVLEHIEDDEQALADWLALARPGGHVVLSVPADPSRFGPWDASVGHFRRYTASDLTRLLTRAGAADITVRHYGWPIAYLLEAVRNRVAKHAVDAARVTTAARTRSSGRRLQPGSLLSGWLIRTGTAPFLLTQRWAPERGPGLIAVATRPPGQDRRESAGPGDRAQAVDVGAVDLTDGDQHDDGGDQPR